MPSGSARLRTGVHCAYHAHFLPCTLFAVGFHPHPNAPQVVVRRLSSKPCAKTKIRSDGSACAPRRTLTPRETADLAQRLGQSGFRAERRNRPTTSRLLVRASCQFCVCVVTTDEAHQRHHEDKAESQLTVPGQRACRPAGVSSQKPSPAADHETEGSSLDYMVRAAACCCA